jgi:hypothetical protein
MGKIDARNGAPKNPGVLGVPPVHAGMTDQQKAAVAFKTGGLGHPTSTGGQALSESLEARPNKDAYGSIPKLRGPSPVNRDMRSRNFDALSGGAVGENLARSKQHTSEDMHALGAAILTEAVLSGSTSLPKSTDEK